jgi:hypothetical protein
MRLAQNESQQSAGLSVLLAVVVWSFIVWDVKCNISMKVNWLFDGTYLRIACWVLHAAFLFALLFSTKEGDVLPRNVGWLLPYLKALYLKLAGYRFSWYTASCPGGLSLKYRRSTAVTLRHMLIVLYLNKSPPSSHQAQISPLVCIPCLPNIGSSFPPVVIWGPGPGDNNKLCIILQRLLWMR